MLDCKECIRVLGGDMNYGWIILGAYILTGGALIVRDFREAPIRQPVYVEEFRRSRGIGKLMLSLVFWLPGVVYSTYSANTRFAVLGREFFALSMFSLLLLIGFVVAL